MCFPKNNRLLAARVGLGARRERGFRVAGGVIDCVTDEQVVQRADPVVDSGRAKVLDRTHVVREDEKPVSPRTSLFGLG